MVQPNATLPKKQVLSRDHGGYIYMILNKAGYIFGGGEWHWGDATRNSWEKNNSHLRGFQVS